MSKPRAFWLHVDHIDNAGGLVWAVQSGGRYWTARSVDVRVPLATRYRKTRQPRAYLRGVGIVQHVGKRKIVILPGR